MKKPLIRKTVGTITRTNARIIFVKLFIPLSKALSWVPSRLLAIEPRYVLWPVRTTIAVAEPLSTFVPRKQTFWSSRALLLRFLPPASSLLWNFLTGKASPVRADWLACRSLDSTSLMSAGIEEGVGECMREMARYYEREAGGEDAISVLPGMHDLLEELDRRGVRSGLVTGNIEEIAHRKLKEAGVRKSFSVGGFGSHSERRSDLVDLAIGRAEKETGERFGKESVFLVGDTPRDVLAGKEAGVATIEVATGKFSRDELIRDGADYTLESLGEKEEFLQIILGGKKGGAQEESCAGA